MRKFDSKLKLAIATILSPLIGGALTTPIIALVSMFRDFVVQGCGDCSQSIEYLLPGLFLLLGFGFLASLALVVFSGGTVCLVLLAIYACFKEVGWVRSRSYLALGLIVGLLGLIVMGPIPEPKYERDIIPLSYGYYHMLIAPIVTMFVFWLIRRPDRDLPKPPPA